jgi:Flp pilus assembly protein TadG
MKQQMQRSNRRGFVLIYYTLCLMFILSVVGLAIDLGMLYNVRAKLAAAIDGASLAGGRCLGRGISFTNAQPIATDTAQRWFAANYPTGFWGSTLNAGDPQVSVTNVGNTMKVQITASVKAPLMFLSIFGYPNSSVGSGGMAVRRNVNLVLVLDRSGSIGRAGAGPDVKSSATNFVNQMVENQDLVGLVSFSGYVHKHFDLETVFKSDANAAISSLVFDGNTNSAAALSTAYQMLQNLNQPGAFNVIVFFTDGRPTALTADFPVRNKAEPGNYRYGNDASNQFQSNTKYAYPAAGTTSCTNNPVLGFIAANTGWPPPSYGYTGGINKETWTTSSDSDYKPAVAATNCMSYGGGKITIAGNAISMVKDSSNSYEAAGRLDIAYIPSPDHFGNITDSTENYMVPDTFPAGSAYPGKIRPDSPSAVRYAAYNAVDNCAKRVRADTSLKPYIFTIGLGGEAGEEPIDDVLLQRLANVTASPVYDPNAPLGIYARVDNSGMLNQAFQEIASQILRLAQ